jgi:hypothetical protein
VHLAADYGPKRSKFKAGSLGVASQLTELWQQSRKLPPNLALRGARPRSYRHPQ